MYKVRLSKEQKDAIKRGHVPTLVAVLEESDRVLVKELKKQRGDVAYQQGASCIVDELLAILKGA